MIKGLKVTLVSVMCLVTGVMVSQAIMWEFFESTTLLAVKDSPFFFTLLIVGWFSVMYVTTMALIQVLVVVPGDH